MTDPDPKPGRGRPRTMDPGRVLDVAVDAYWKDDPADVSVNAICQRAGVSKPSLYRDFGSEDGLTRAALDSYSRRVLSDVMAILEAGRGLAATLAALVDFASDDPRMDTGCLFYKMRAGKHRLGPRTRALVEDLDRSARDAYARFLQSCLDRGDWAGGLPVTTAATYLNEQVAWAITLRAAGEDPARIREMLTLALSVFAGDPGDRPG